MGLMGMFSGLEIGASGLRAQRLRQNVIASNLANAETTRTPEGGPYRRQTVVLRENQLDSEQRFVFGPEKMKGYTTQSAHIAIPEPGLPLAREQVGSGVEVASIEADSSPPRLIHDPSHPDANAEGYVALPNVNVVQEMTDMITATRTYEANATSFNATKGMLLKALEL